MKKILLATILVSTTVFAGALDMSNLKCGDFQIYSNTTLQDIRTNCKILKETMMVKQNERNLPSKYWYGQNSMYEVHFMSTSTPEMVRCDFLDNKPDSYVVGCR